MFSFPQKHGPALLSLILSALNETTAGLDLWTSRCVWKADKILRRKKNNKNKNKNGREKRNPEAAAVFGMLIW